MWERKNFAQFTFQAAVSPFLGFATQSASIYSSEFQECSSIWVIDHCCVCAFQPVGFYVQLCVCCVTFCSYRPPCCRWTQATLAAGSHSWNPPLWCCECAVSVCACVHACVQQRCQTIYCLSVCWHGASSTVLELLLSPSSTMNRQYRDAEHNTLWLYLAPWHTHTHTHTVSESEKEKERAE